MHDSTFQLYGASVLVSYKHLCSLCMQSLYGKQNILNLLYAETTAPTAVVRLHTDVFDFSGCRSDRQLRDFMVLGGSTSSD